MISSLSLALSLCLFLTSLCLRLSFCRQRGIDSIVPQIIARTVVKRVLCSDTIQYTYTYNTVYARVISRPTARRGVRVRKCVFLFCQKRIYDSGRPAYTE